MNEREGQNENEERSQRRRPRVVDKRVSAGGPPTEPASDRPGPDPTPPAEERSEDSHAAKDAETETPASATAAPGQDVGGERVWTPEQEAEARRIAEEMARVPALDWVANAAVTLINVAAAKLDRDDLVEARLAIDALAALISGVGDRLGDVHTPLSETLAQLQMAYANKASPPAGRP